MMPMLSKIKNAITAIVLLFVTLAFWVSFPITMSILFFVGVAIMCSGVVVEYIAKLAKRNKSN